MAQESINTSIEGIQLRNILPDEYFTELRDYCPLFKNSEIKTISGFKSGNKSFQCTEWWSGGEDSGGTPISSDNWVEYYTLPFGPTSPKAVVRGTFPQFNPIGSDVISVSGTPKTMSFNNVKIYIDNLILYIESGGVTHMIYQTKFKDRTTPRRLLVTIQASGGGGGCGAVLSNGTGGGSGGFLVLILNLEKTLNGAGKFEISIGSFGAGGAVGKPGNDAATSAVRWHPLGMPPITIATVDGGKGGGYADSQSEGTGGDGGDSWISPTHLNDYFFIPEFYAIHGNSAGNSYSSDIKLVCTNRPNLPEGVSSLIHPKQPAVETSDSGGASVLGRGGWYTQGRNHDGILGSGGGGGYIFGGHPGGQGVAYLYY